MKKKKEKILSKPTTGAGKGQVNEDTVHHESHPDSGRWPSQQSADEPETERHLGSGGAFEATETERDDED